MLYALLLVHSIRGLLNLVNSLTHTGINLNKNTCHFYCKKEMHLRVTGNISFCASNRLKYTTHLNYSGEDKIYIVQHGFKNIYFPRCVYK